MRHFRLPRPVTALTLGMGMAPRATGLKALASRLHAMLAYLGRASKRTVALTPVAVAANEHWGAAAGTQVASCGKLHRQRGADGGWARQNHTFREILTSATSPSRARGATSVGTWSLWPVSRLLKLSRQDQFLLHLVARARFAAHRHAGGMPLQHSMSRTAYRAQGGVCSRPSGSFQHPLVANSSNLTCMTLPPDLRAS